jgi:hypothetical protein
MKMSSVLSSLLFCGICFAAPSALAQNNKEALVRYRDLSKPTTLASLLSEGNVNKTFEFIADDRIPVEIKFQSDVFAIEPDEKNMEFVVKTPFLMKFDPEPSISFDSVRFVPISKAFTGKIGLSIGSDSNSNPKVSLIQFFGELSRKNGQ